MSSSGITRRIDELGRIVIPKEIRYNLGIREGEPLEIIVDNNTILIKKFSQINNIKSVSDNICMLISDVFNVNIIITDREKIIATNKELNNLINTYLKDSQKKLIDNRESYISNLKEKIFDIEGYFYILPIITSTDSSGLVIVSSNEQNNNNIKYAKIAQKLLIYKIDIE